MLKDMTVCLEYLGMVNPMKKVYNQTPKDLDYFPLMACLMTINILTQLTYDPHIFSLVKRSKELLIDGPHFIVGLLTVFKQFHPIQYKKYLLYMSHFVKNAIFNSSQGQAIQKSLPADAYMVFVYLEELIRFDGSTREVVS